MQHHAYIKFPFQKYFAPEKTKKTFLMDMIVLALIFLLTILFVLSSYPFFEPLYNYFHSIEWVIMILFSIEFFLRLLSYHSIKGFFSSVYTWIDLGVLIPFWFGLGFIMFFRILRFFRIFRYWDAYLHVEKLLGERHFEKMFLIRIVFSLLCIVFLSASFIYIFEYTLNPSINTFGDAFYFTLVTIATVGFGDIVPITHLGKITTMLMIIMGVLLIPWHIAMFIRYYVLSHKNPTTCSSCGLKYHDNDAVFCKNCGQKIYHEHDGETPSVFIP